MPSVVVRNAAGADVTVQTLPAVGQAAKADSLPVTLANDSNALPITDNNTSLTVDSTQLPSTIGRKVITNSLSVVHGTDDPVAVAVGLAADAATPDTAAGGASFTFTSLFKGMVVNLLAIKNALLGTLTTQVTPDQDPIYNHTAGVKVAVTTSATVITPPTGCKYIEIGTDVDIVVNTAAITTVVDNGTAIHILANQPRTIPVVAGTAVKALSLGASATVRATPLKVR